MATARAEPIHPLTMVQLVRIMSRSASMNIPTLVALMAAHRTVSSRLDDACTVFDQAAVARMQHHLEDLAHDGDACRGHSAASVENADGCS